MKNVKETLNIIFKNGHKILKDRILGYDEKRSDFTQPYYYFLAGFVKSMQVSTVVEIGTHKGGSGLAMKIGMPNLNLLTIDTNEYELAKDRLDELGNCKRIIGNPLYIFTYLKVRFYLRDKSNPKLLFIDAKKDGDWIDKILKRYLFLDADYILVDDITFDEKMTLWWRNFCSKHSNALNIVDYLGREVRNSKSSDNNLNCGFGLISKNDFQL